MTGSVGSVKTGCRVMLGEKRAEVPSSRIRLKRQDWEGGIRRGNGRVSRRGIGTVWCGRSAGREVGGAVSKEAMGGLVGTGSGVGVGEFRIGPAESTLLFSRFRDSFRANLCTVVRVTLSDMGVVLLARLSLLLLEGGGSNELASWGFVTMMVGVARGVDNGSKKRRGNSKFGSAPAGKPSIMHRSAAGVIPAWSPAGLVAGRGVSPGSPLHSFVSGELCEYESSPSALHDSTTLIFVSKGWDIYGFTPSIGCEWPEYGWLLCMSSFVFRVDNGKRIRKWESFWRKVVLRDWFAR